MPCNPESPLKVCLVQFEAEDDLYFAPGQFESRISDILSQCFSEGNQDLVIFPEYTSVFLALSPFGQVLRGKKTTTEAFGAIKSMPAQDAATPSPVFNDFKSLFLAESGYVEAKMKRIFGSLARQYRTTIIAGTYFSAEGEKLKNRAMVFGPGGDVIYTQDKVFLTPMERDLFQITPGEISKAVGFSCAGRRMVLTICRDSLEPIWSSHYNGKDFRETDIWIDIKANGEVFTYTVEDSFTQFMPARLKDTNIPYGITVCLVGSFLEFFWEGESSVIRKTDGEIEVLQEATNPVQAQILMETLR